MLSRCPSRNAPPLPHALPPPLPAPPSGHPKQVMVIYNGIHYDALAISPGPRASESEDATEFNPRTKRGKMIMAAAQKLVELTHRREGGWQN